MTPLADWATFYEVLGSASAALTGLQFVTIALLSDIPMRDPAEAATGEAFATPTIVHFTSALFLAAAGAAPWATLLAPAVLWALTGATGLIYTLIVLRRIRAQNAYHPVLEDWTFHIVLPLVAYAGLLTAAALARTHRAPALITVAASALLLLFIGVHNAWDNVTFLALRKRKQDPLTQPTESTIK